MIRSRKERMVFKENLKIIEWLLRQLEQTFARDKGDNAICPYCSYRDRFLYDTSGHDPFCKYRIALKHYQSLKGESDEY